MGEFVFRCASEFFDIDERDRYAYIFFDNDKGYIGSYTILENATRYDDPDEARRQLHQCRPELTWELIPLEHAIAEELLYEK